jgi:hypothetical protein
VNRPWNRRVEVDALRQSFSKAASTISLFAIAAIGAMAAIASAVFIAS